MPHTETQKTEIVTFRDAMRPEHLRWVIHLLERDIVCWPRWRMNMFFSGLWLIVRAIRGLRVHEDTTLDEMEQCRRDDGILDQHLAGRKV